MATQKSQWLHHNNAEVNCKRQIVPALYPDHEHKNKTAGAAMGLPFWGILPRHLVSPPKLGYSEGDNFAKPIPTI